MHTKYYITYIVVLFVAMTSATVTVAQVQPSQKWSPAIYRGLTIGKSARADVMRVLGKPAYVGREEDTGTPILTFDVHEPVSGSMTVYIAKGILSGLSLTPKRQMTVDDVIHLFGKNYIIARYDFDDCLSDGGAAPVYQSPNGQFKHMEYPSHGLAINFYHDDPQEIIYTDRPSGPDHSICKERSKKK